MFEKEVLKKSCVNFGGLLLPTEIIQCYKMAIRSFHVKVSWNNF